MPKVFVSFGEHRFWMLWIKQMHALEFDCKRVAQDLALDDIFSSRLHFLCCVVGALKRCSEVQKRAD